MFDLNDDGTVTPQEFEEITGALQQRLRKVSKLQRTGANIAQCATPCSCPSQPASLNLEGFAAGSIRALWLGAERTAAKALKTTCWGRTGRNHSASRNLRTSLKVTAEKAWAPRATVRVSC